MGVITKPSSVQRSVIVRLQVACGMAAGCGGAHSQQAARGAVYRRRGLLPRAQHALLLPQTVDTKRAIFSRSVRRQPIASAWVMEGLGLFLCRGLSTRLGTDRTRRPGTRALRMRAVRTPHPSHVHVTVHALLCTPPSCCLTTLTDACVWGTCEESSLNR